MCVFLKWFFFLSKRLYKKATFLILLLLIPLSGISLKIASGESSGFVRVALVNEDKGDAFTEGVIDDLIAGTTLIRFTQYETQQQALTALDAGKADTVWVFPEDLQAKIERYADEKTAPEEGIIRVRNREEGSVNRIALESLSGTLYPHMSRRVFLSYIRNSKNFDLSALTDEEIFAYYDHYHSDDPLFAFAYPDGVGIASASEPVHFLTAPIRGMLSVIVVLCGMAAAMLFLRDENKGTFAWAKPSSRFWICIASQASAILSTGLMMLFAVYLLGANVLFFREVLVLFLFMINSTLFCTLLQQLIRRVSALATVATVLTVLMLIVCPIFFDTKLFKWPQMLFPPTYYINSAYNNTYLLYSLLYGASLSLLLFLISLRRYRR